MRRPCHIAAPRTPRLRVAVVCARAVTTCSISGTPKPVVARVRDSLVLRGVKRQHKPQGSHTHGRVDR